MESSLDLSLVYVPKTITELLREVSRIKTASLKLSKLDDYVNRLEDEMKKIVVFKRELPLCMLLLNDAIERLKQEAMPCKGLSDDGSVELLALKRSIGEDKGANLEKDCCDKKDWLSSVQLWNNNNNNNIDNNNSDHEQQDPVSQQKLRIVEEHDRPVSENSIQMGSYGNSRGGSFMSFKGESGGFAWTEMKESRDDVTQIPGLSLMSPVTELGSCNSSLKSNGSGRVGSGSTLFTEQNQIKLLTKSQQPLPQECKKQRRCWSPELHRRFVDALQHLGGSQVATPKQIRDLMQVDGLTNDEVKSHLQKYRLHIRKLPASAPPPPNGLCIAQDQSNGNSKLNMSQCGSPQGPLLASGYAKGISSTGGDSMEEEEDEKSDGQSWKGGIHNPIEV
ncbi:Myb_DNA-binding domain-containing protein [Cephalotus follicularis]|uniref:Myb_DNA-binding domain-containing protein n=1 Tax=Cephalotus follicularis TaxID=3775 RepID=A0A1Q3D9E5_CEPFO|nr:Myb_DNA-binding domain-containing protein [Cephalotus follicularis]